jgi:hypothetical protein
MALRAADQTTTVAVADIAVDLRFGGQLSSDRRIRVWCRVLLCTSKYSLSSCQRPTNLISASLCSLVAGDISTSAFPWPRSSGTVVPQPISPSYRRVISPPNAASSNRDPRETFGFLCGHNVRTETTAKSRLPNALSRPREVSGQQHQRPLDFPVGQSVRRAPPGTL